MAEISQSAIDVAKVLTPFITAALAAYTRNSSGTGRGKPAKEKARYAFISEFIETGIEGRHPLVVEQAFAVHFGNKFDYEEIIALLGAKNPLRCFCLLKSARKFVAIGSSGSLEYKHDYATERKRWWHKRWYYFLYGTLMYAAILPVMFAAKILGETNATGIVSLALLVFVFLIFAFVLLDKAESLKIAEKLIRLQNGFDHALQPTDRKAGPQLSWGARLNKKLKAMRGGK